MSEEINDLLADLSARLPELEWKVAGIGAAFTSRNLPRGLFRSLGELTGAACVAEIKSDIFHLATQQNQRSAAYLAQRIKEKINVLVALCQIHAKKTKVNEQVHFGLKMLSTRQQWIQSLEDDINTLSRQQESLNKAFNQMKNNAASAEALLSVRAELGEVERRLTLAQEALNHAIS